MTTGIQLESPLTVSDDFAPVDLATWRAQVEADLQGAPFDKKLVSLTYDGIPIAPLYQGETPDRGFAGLWPFVRGGAPLGNRAHGWTLCAEHRHPDCDATADAARADLERGATAFCLKVATAERDGVVLADVDALSLCLTAARPETPIYLDAGEAFYPAAALWLACIRKHGISFNVLKGGLGADPLGALAATGKLSQGLDAALAQAADLAVYTKKNLPGVKALRVDTRAYHDAGATEAQELGLALSTGVAYLRALEAAGLPIDAAAEQLVFGFSVGTQFFLEIAKLRAARRLWAEVLSACGVTDVPMVQHVRPAARVLTRRDPWVNLLRNTAVSFAAAVGGADVQTTLPLDEALGLPTDFSRRIARNTQIVLREESHLDRIVDPAGGSYAIEALTDELATKAWAFFQLIEGAGGLVEALKSGLIAEKLAAVVKARAGNLAKRKDAITGVNEFPLLSETPPAAPAPFEAKVFPVVAPAAVGQGFGAAIDAAATASFPALVAAYTAGTATTVAALPARPLAAAYEALRDRSDALLAKTGKRPEIFLANLGPIAHHTARATFSKGFFEAGGFETLTNNGFKDGAAAAEAFAKTGAKVAVICSSDKLYPELVPAAAAALKAAGARQVIVAGRAGELEAAWREAGVDRFIFLGCDVLATLTELADICEVAR